jgi:preprotein translocase subunit SecF
VVSFVASTIGLVLFIGIGPNWSIDFTGGTEVEVHFEQATTIAEVRGALAPQGIAEDAVYQVGPDADSRFVVRLQGESSSRPEDVAAVRAALEAAFGSDWIDSFEVGAEVGSRAAVRYRGASIPLDRVEAALAVVPGSTVQGSPEENTFFVRLPGVAEGIHRSLEGALGTHGLKFDRSDSVGPKVGGNLRAAGLTAVAWSVVLHLIYVAVRFDFAFAPGAIICLVHDVAITCGILVIARLDFGLSTVSALLTLTGYSLNDTIVVYDRIRENMHRFKRKDFGALINESINQTLSRTIMTSGATALAMVPFLFKGGAILQEFAIVMLVGIVVGTYSSIYVAAPLTMILTENQDRIRALFGLSKKA